MNADQNTVVVVFTRLLRRICADEHMEIAIDTPLDDIPGIDSLRLLHAIAQLEEHFRVEIDVVAIDDLYLVQDIVNAISTARPQQSGSSERL